jgi:hypothetical protein
VITTTITAQELQELLDKVAPELRKKLDKCSSLGTLYDELCTTANLCLRLDRLARYLTSLSPSHPVTINLDIELILRHLP